MIISTVTYICKCISHVFKLRRICHCRPGGRGRLKPWLIKTMYRTIRQFREEKLRGMKRTVSTSPPPSTSGLDRPSGPRSPLLVSSIKLRHTTLGRFRCRVIGPRQRPLPDNTQHSQETDVHAPGVIRTRQRAAVEPPLRPRGHSDRLFCEFLRESVRDNVLHCQS
jgi:hypothetical protein